MPDERCEIEKLKIRFENFEEDFKDHYKREDEYMAEFKKKLCEVSENLQQVIETQNKQINYVAGIVSAFVFIGGVAYAIFSWFFQK